MGGGPPANRSDPRGWATAPIPSVTMSAATAPAPLARWHSGRWTMVAAEPGQPGIVGRLMTWHEMQLDVVHIVRKRRWNEPELMESHAEIRALMRVEIEYLPEAIPIGTGVVPVHETELLEALENVSARALRWLNDRAPAGYTFSMVGGLHLLANIDLSANHIAPEAILSIAADRGLAIPRDLANLAVAHVVGPPHGEQWRAIYSAVFVAAGPVGSQEEAIEVVRGGRMMLRDHLQDRGAADLAETFSRWTEIPVDH
jgi:hypothetical protein